MRPFEVLTGVLALALLPHVDACDVDIPGYCDPGDPYDCSALIAYDQSSFCQGQNIGIDTCCVTVVGMGQFTDYSQQNLQDLELAVSEQIADEHWYHDTRVGIWHLAYAPYLNGAIPSNVTVEFFHALSEFWTSPDAQAQVGRVGNIFFLAGGHNTFSITIATPDT